MLGLLYVRAVQAADLSWQCRIGLTEYDRHPSLEDALLHLRKIGDSEGDGMPFEIVVHPLDGPPRFLRGEEITRIGMQ